MQTVKAILLGVGLLVLPGLSLGDLPESPNHGELVRQNDAWLAWNDPRSEWLSVEAFWLDYTARSSGKYWGRGMEYPPYREVSEFDTFLVELEQGPCLMIFFHGRWRRAEDVRRWDPQFNDLHGCPYVFD